MTFSVWLFAAAALFLLATLTFVAAALLRKNDLADVLWGPGFPLSALAGWLLGAPSRAFDPRTALAFLLVTIWAIRLFLHIGLRNLSTRKEDERYHNWRIAWGTTWLWRSYLQVFLLQALVLLVINAPLLLLFSADPVPVGPTAYAGTTVWLFGFLFETIADEQLRRFRAANKGKLITTGLWSWSRHPNYFGEVVQWWGIFLFALPLPHGWATVLSPLAITFLILKVSGVPMLEKLMDSRPGIEEYRRRTSEFFPLPPRR